jgi:hypothetical protein
MVNKIIMGIDPGTFKSGWCIIEGLKIVNSGVSENGLVKQMIRDIDVDLVAIEGMEPRRSNPNAKFPVIIGSETFDTCIWIGRFIENATSPFRIVKRGEVLRHIAKHRANDSDVRKALIAKLGVQGTKSNKGATYGVSSHAWSALAVALTALETPDVNNNFR